MDIQPKGIWIFNVWAFDDKFGFLGAVNKNHFLRISKKF